jgi:hypothetical protein
MTGNDMADRGSIPGIHEQHFSLRYHIQNVLSPTQQDPGVNQSSRINVKVFLHACMSRPKRRPFQERSDETRWSHNTKRLV